MSEVTVPSTEPTTPPAKRPIKDFKEAAVAIAAVAVVVAEGYGKGEIDLPKILALMPKIQAGIEGYENIAPELMDMDSAEAQEVIAAVAAEIKVSNEKAKEVTIASLGIIVPAMKLYKAVSK